MITLTAVGAAQKPAQLAERGMTSEMHLIDGVEEGRMTRMAPAVAAS